MTTITSSSTMLLSLTLFLMIRVVRLNIVLVGVHLLMWVLRKVSTSISIITNSSGHTNSSGQLNHGGHSLGGTSGGASTIIVIII